MFSVKGMDPCNHGMKNFWMVKFLKEFPFLTRKLESDWWLNYILIHLLTFICAFYFFLSLLFYSKLYFL